MTKRSTKTSQKARETLVPPLEREPIKKQRSPVVLAREEASRSTQERISASVGRSVASSSRVQLDPQGTSDLTREEPVTKATEPSSVQPAVQPHLVALPQSPVLGGSSSQPTNPKPVIVKATKMAATVAGFRVPNPWDNNSPKFDGKTASSLKRFLRHCASIVDQGQITDIDDQKAKLLDYVHDDDVRDQFEKLDTYQTGTFEEWCKEIEKLYPEIEDMGIGSLEKLSKICLKAKGLAQNDLGAIRRFSVSFTSEAEKLLKPPASVTNKILVDAILGVLEKGFSTSVESMMNHKLVMENTTSVSSSVLPTVPAAAVPAAPAVVPVAAAAVAAAGPVTVNRRGDRLDYKKVLEIAEKIADNWAGRDANPLLGGVSSLLVGTERDESVLLQNSPMAGFQREVTDRLNTVSGEIASLKDGAAVQEKQFKASLDKMEDSLKDSFRTSLVQYTRGPPPHQDINPAGGSSNQGPDRTYAKNAELAKQFLCFFCNGPHMIKDCPHKEEYINIGWLRVENSRMRLGDGGYIPRYPDWMSKKDHVDEHYSKLGITKESARRTKSNLVQGMQDDVLDYDSREDERRSYATHVALMNAAQLNQNHQEMGMPMNQFVQSQSNNTPGMYSLSLQNIAQLVNTIKDNELSNQQGTQQQLVNTRTGKSSQGNPNFQGTQ